MKHTSAIQPIKDVFGHTSLLVSVAHVRLFDKHCAVSAYLRFIDSMQHELLGVSECLR